MDDKQKRALGIGGVALGGILLWRHMHSGSTRTVIQPVSTQGSIQPYTPQTPIPLQPGESIYDPNSQALLSTPTPVNTSSALAGPGNQASTPSAPNYVVNVAFPKATPVKRAATHGPVKAHHPKIVRNRPKAKKKVTKK